MLRQSTNPALNRFAATLPDEAISLADSFIEQFELPERRASAYCMLALAEVYPEVTHGEVAATYGYPRKAPTLTNLRGRIKNNLYTSWFDQKILDELVTKLKEAKSATS